MKEVLWQCFDIENAYDMMYREGVLLMLQRIETVGRFYNWVLSLLFGRTIQVKVGNVLSQMVNVENGTPQGSAISPVFFNIMINNVFEGIHPGISTALYADDGAMGQRGQCLNLVILQTLLSKVPLTPILRHCSNKYKLAREGEKEKDENLESILFVVLSMLNILYITFRKQ